MGMVELGYKTKATSKVLPLQYATSFHMISLGDITHGVGTATFDFVQWMRAPFPRPSSYQSERPVTRCPGERFANDCGVVVSGRRCRQPIWYVPEGGVRISGWYHVDESIDHNCVPSWW